MSHHRRARSPIVQRRSTIRSISTNKPINYDCRLCKQNHALRKCVRFNKMNVSERRQLVQLFKYCENCLAHSHLLPNCRVQSRCRHCGAKHHTLLHCHERLTTSTGFEVPTASFGTVIPTVILKVNLNSAWQSVRGLLNPCAEFSAIAQFLVQRFEVPCERVGDDEWCMISFRSRFDEGPTFKVTAKVTKDLPTLLGRKKIGGSPGRWLHTLTPCRPKILPKWRTQPRTRSRHLPTAHQKRCSATVRRNGYGSRYNAGLDDNWTNWCLKGNISINITKLLLLTKHYT